jgi:hypothetical protein
MGGRIGRTQGLPPMATAIAAALIAASGFAAPAFAQVAQPKADAPAYKAPRTSFGQPSLEGVWTHNFLIVLEGMGQQPPPLVLPEEAAQQVAAQMADAFAKNFDQQLDPEVPELMKVVDGFPIVRGERRTRALIEPASGKLPYTPDARRESGRYGNAPYDNPEQRPNWERCVTSLGLPPVTGVGTTSANPRMIVQTPTHVIIHTEYGNEARLIPFTDTHKPKELRDVLGDSIARWEGDTLVVETIDPLESDRVRAFANLVVPHDSKVIERFTRVSDKELLYQFTVENPKIYTAPWMAEYSLYSTDHPMLEHACHEGNHSLPNILRGAREVERQKAAKAAKP